MPEKKLGPLYHGTWGDIEKLGDLPARANIQATHVGSKESALERLINTGYANILDKHKPTLLEVMINPPDIGTPIVSDMEASHRTYGLRHAFTKKHPSIINTGDVLPYFNQVEDPGEISYALFSPQKDILSQQKVPIHFSKLEESALDMMNTNYAKDVARKAWNRFLSFAKQNEEWLKYLSIPASMDLTPLEMALKGQNDLGPYRKFD